MKAMAQEHGVIALLFVRQELQQIKERLHINYLFIWSGYFQKDSSMMSILYYLANF